MTDISSEITRLRQRSAGGVVIRPTDEGCEVALILSLPDRRWQLPKGLIDPGETAEQAAVRETREEAGIAAEVIAGVGSTKYSFRAKWDGVPRNITKVVDWYAMRYLSGDVADHDDEVAEARWFAADTAAATLFFDNERAILLKALEVRP